MTDVQLQPSSLPPQAPAAVPDTLTVTETADTLLEQKRTEADAARPSILSPVSAENKHEIHKEKWKEFRITKGDTLSRLFARAGHDVKTLYKVMGDDKQNKRLEKIYPGQTIAFLEGPDGQLKKIRLIVSALEQFDISLNQEGQYRGQMSTKQPDIQLAVASGTIDSSLFVAAQKAGLSDRLTMALADIFGWDVDFVLDIRKGDSFSVLYEQKYLDGKKIGDGRILAASFTNQGEQHQAILYQLANGDEAYFAPDGRSMKGAFLRSPIPFARISSHFTSARKHPVLHRIRAHKGTDYAASRGTPVKATGEGKVLLAGRKGGYGKTVVLQHGHKYTTLYAHLSRYGKGIRAGKRVRQGQIVGYVGSTGLATGPHLHYEFRVNGVHKNPVTVKLPKAESIPKAEMARFQQNAAKLLAKLKSGNGNTQLAMANSRQDNP